MVFARTNQRCKLIEDCLNHIDKPPGLAVVRVAGLPEMSAAKRMELVKGKPGEPSEFARATFGILINCNAIATGFDLPQLAVAWFLDPRGQGVSLIQAIGRVGRLDREVSANVGPQLAYVDIPFYEAGSPEDFEREADDVYNKLIQKRALQSIVGWLPAADPWPACSAPPKPRQPCGHRKSRTQSADEGQDLPRLKAMQRHISAVIRVFMNHDPCIGISCAEARGYVSACGGHGGWEAFFEQSDSINTAAILSSISTRPGQTAQAYIDWSKNFAAIAKRARNGSPCRGSQWLFRYRGKARRKKLDAARSHAFDELDALVRQNRSREKAVGPRPKSGRERLQEHRRVHPRGKRQKRQPGQKRCRVALANSSGKGVLANRQRRITPGTKSH